MNSSIRKFFILATILFASHYQILGQISPPGLSDTHIASWWAVGLDQQIGQSSKRHSFTYIGFGRMSDPESKNLLNKPSMFILNEEYKQQFTRHMSYTAALSYRRQNLYDETAPYASSNPGIRQELRAYGKLTYSNKWGKNKWNVDFRPEFRKFFGPSFSAIDPVFALRSRFKAKATIPLTENQVHQLILSAETLFEDENNLLADGKNKDWSGFQYADTRFCIYYRLTPEDWPLYVELGYMNQLDGTAPAVSRHHIGLDIVFTDLFTHIK